MSLREKIEAEIEQRGPMPFSRYMEICLYHPELGYYSRNAEQFGKAGDFYTSSDVHAVFGRLMSRQFEEIWRTLDRPPKIDILELGPGRGLFARDVLDWSQKKFPDFFAALHYSLLEQSPTLRQRLETTLATHLESGRASLVSTPNIGPAIIFANEFFDALPVEIVSTQGALHIDKGLTETWRPISSEQQLFLDRYSVQPEPGERLEVALIAQIQAAKIAAAMNTGILIAIDYGYTRAEQLAGRYRGTLMTYRQHSAGANPYEAPGEQDITAHVNFSALAAVLPNPRPLLTQSQFLLGIEESTQFADAFEDCRLPQERAKVALQLKHLVTPTGMGEAFQVLIATKDLNPENLSGLTFTK